MKLLHKAYDGGINFFDTARAYSDSEQKVGAAFSSTVSYTHLDVYKRQDEGCSKAVRETFCELYDKGLIYKGSRIINWCPWCWKSRPIWRCTPL